MLALLFALSTAHATQGEVTFSLGTEIVGMAIGTITHNAETIGDSYVAAGTFSDVFASVELGNGRIGALVLSSTRMFADSEGAGDGYNSNTVGVIGHHDNWSLYAAIGAPYGSLTNDMDADSSLTTRAGVRRRFVDCEPFAVAVGVDAYRHNYDYPFGYDVNHSGATISLHVSHTSR